MDLGGASWVIIDIVAVAALVAVLLFVFVRNRGRRADAGESERATRDLYDAEESRRREDDGA